MQKTTDRFCAICVFCENLKTKVPPFSGTAINGLGLVDGDYGSKNHNNFKEINKRTHNLITRIEE